MENNGADEIDRDITPDQYRLDWEWSRQGRLRRQYGTDMAHAYAAWTDAKNALKAVEAVLYLRISSEPEKYGLPKTTEAAINAAMVLQAEYKEAQRNLIKAKFRLDMREAAVKAIDDKKFSLQDLVKLHFGDYFADPKPPEGARNDIEQMEKQHIRRRGQKQT